MPRYKLDEVRKFTTYSSNWGFFVIRPIADRMLWAVANYTRLTPNQLTGLSFLALLASAWCFFQGTYGYLILGAFLFELWYAIDCVDGALARLKGMESKLGLYLDSMTAHWGIFFVVLGLAYGQFRLTGEVLYLILGFAYLFTSMLNYVTSPVIWKIDPDGQLSSRPITREDSLLGRVLASLQSRGIKTSVTNTDMEALVFFIFPLTIQVKLGLVASIALLVAGAIAGFIFYFRPQRSK